MDVYMATLFGHVLRVGFSKKPYPTLHTSPADIFALNNQDLT